MRLLSNIALVSSVAAFGFAGGALGLSLVAPPHVPFAAPERAAMAASLPRDDVGLAPVWPSIFGVVVIPEPEPVAVVEPEPEPEPVAEAEPEENTIYYLTGLVTGGAESWAMVASNDRTQVVRVGDTLEGGEIVRAIDARGVWIDWGEIRQVIPVQRSDLSALARIERVATADLASTGPTTEFNWPVEQLDARFIEEAFVEAGTLSGAVQPDGSNGLDVVLVRNGQLYDQIGLKTGDTILRINGKPVDQQGLPAETPSDVVNSGALDLEILRDGARQVIRVNLDQI